MRILASEAVIAKLAIAIVLVQLASVMLTTAWPFYTIQKLGWTELLIGISPTFSGVLTVFIRGGQIRLVVPRYGDGRVIMGALLAQTVGLGVLSLGWRAWMMFLGIVFNCLSGLAFPVLSSVASHRVSTQHQGELQGAIASLTSLAAIIGPLMSEQLFAIFTGSSAFMYLPSAPLLLGAMFGAIALALLAPLGLAGFLDAPIDEHPATVASVA